MKLDRTEIEKRQKKLERCRKYLKREFIGIDGIVDELIDYIRVWYLMPEVLTRPVIVNLWGMTGVGKTDLVRKLVKYLSYQDRFAEIELSNTGGGNNWRTSVFEIMDEHSLNDGEPAIALFDEVQRFYTVQEDGRPTPTTGFSDFWELLSDGSLSRKERVDADYRLLDLLNRKKNAALYADGPVKPTPANPWEVREIMKSIGIAFDLGSAENMTEDHIIEMLTKSKKSKKIYEPIDHKKTLIIISGNLDNAFMMADLTSETDVDADIFNAFTQKITMVDIKNALSRKFRPEQVARFGNIHLIYHSLKRKDFEKLIAKEIKRLIKQAKSNLGIDLTVGPNIAKLIYRNGVFPVQGVRPVFSSINEILESNLSRYFFEALMAGKKTVEIDYDEVEQALVAKVGRTKVSTPFVGRIDQIRESNDADAVASISVHECGHAIVYMMLTGLIPLQLKSKVASSYAAGFTFPHDIHDTHANMLAKIQIYLAGGIAEEIIFGPEQASVGRGDDRNRATRLACDFVRTYGFDEKFQSVYSMEELAYQLDRKVTDFDIEKMMSRLAASTREILVRNRDCLVALSEALTVVGSLDAPEIGEIAERFGIVAKAAPEGHLYISKYGQMLEDAKN